MFYCLSTSSLNLSLLLVNLNSSISYQPSVDKAHLAGCAWCQCISVSGSWLQLLFITGGAKAMTSCPCRSWKWSPDRTVMTKELPGNIVVHRGQEKKVSWGCVFLSFCSSHLPLWAHQPFSGVWNSPLTCVSFLVLNVGHGGGAESSPN